MKLSLTALMGVVLAATIGCRKSELPPEPPKVEETPVVENPPAASGGGIQIHGGGAGPMAPVTGTESLQGSGGSAGGQVLKDRARGIGSSPSSLDQYGGGE
ncbi:MAG TPA: hypothetical protein VM328_03440 [Fimbriimonadaceae bacterium]|nr:hypothetical protein [Fimbriimonadaceae bacterium]